MDIKDLLKPKGIKKGVYLFIGDEEYLLYKVIENIKKDLKGRVKISNYVVSKQNDLIESLSRGAASSLFSPEEIIKIEVTRNISFKSEKKRKELRDALSFVRHFVFIYGKNLNEKSSFTVLIKEMGIPVIKVYGVSERIVYQIVSDFFKENHKKISYYQIEKILEKAPDELFLLEAELKKLLIFIGDKEAVGDSDIDAIFSDSSKEKLKSLYSSIFTKKALQVYRELLNSGYESLYLWNVIVSYLKNSYKNYGEKKSFYWRRERILPIEKIKKALSLAYDYDKKIKAEYRVREDLIFTFLAEISIH